MVGAAAQWRVGHIGGGTRWQAARRAMDSTGAKWYGIAAASGAARALSHMSQKTICACVSGVCAMMARAT